MPVEPALNFNQQPKPEPTIRKAVVAPEKDWSDDRALVIAKNDYNEASDYRQQNHDWRWTQADLAFTAWREQRFWEGTRVPRASIGMHVVLQQVESLTARLVSAIFSGMDWFEAFPIGTTTPKAARAVRDIMLAQLEPSRPRDIGRRVIKSAAKYGNGILRLDWVHSEYKRKTVVPEFIPERRQERSLVTGVSYPVPTGRVIRSLREVDESVVDNRPSIDYVSLRDFYIDPHAPSPEPKKARFVCERRMMTVFDLIQLRDEEGFSVPKSDNIMEWWASVKHSTSGDTGKRSKESARRGTYDPLDDVTADLALQRVEVIKYIQKDRCVWFIPGANHILYNGPNPFGFINYYSAFYVDLLDRFYAMSIADVAEPEQRLQEGLLNARLDEIALGIHPPTVHRSGSANARIAMRYRPGNTIASEDPAKDVVRQFPNNITQQAFQEQTVSDLRVQKNTGITDLSASGAPNVVNPAARSATGAAGQLEAAFSRQRHIADNIQVAVFEPLFEDIHTLNKRFLDPNQMISALDGRQIDPLAVWAADVRFQMRGASRIAAKTTMVNFLPLLLQFMMNPALIQQLSLTGKVPNFEELFDMVADATGYDKRSDLIRPMNEQEQQMLQQRQPSREQVELQKQRERMQAMEQMALDKNDVDILREFIKANAKQLGTNSAMDMGDLFSDPSNALGGL